MTTSTLLETFCEHSLYMRGVSPQTIKRYREQVAYYIRHSGVNSASEVNQTNVFSFFIYGRSERKWKPSTYRSYYMSLRVFFRWCRKHGHMERDPLEGMELPKMQLSLPKGLSKEQALELIECVVHLPYERSFQRIRNHALFSTLIFTGLRKGELLNLKIQDVDLKNNALFVRMGKGQKDRMVPIGSRLREVLHRYVDARESEKKLCSHFFTSAKTDTQFTSAGLKHLTNRIKRESKMKFNIHSLRHTFATLMLHGGCDIYSLSRMMGHSNIKTTTIYLAATTEHLQVQVAKHPLNF